MCVGCMVTAEILWVGEVNDWASNPLAVFETDLTVSLTFGVKVRATGQALCGVSCVSLTGLQLKVDMEKSPTEAIFNGTEAKIA